MRTHMFTLCSVSTLILCSFMLSAASAQDTLLITYQGRLTDDGGTPVNGTPAMTFTIYDGGGVSKWSEAHPSVAVDNGLFAVILGSQTALMDSVFSGENRYLGISVNGDPEVSPRTLLTSSPGAAVSRRVAGDVETSPGRLQVRPVADPGGGGVSIDCEGDNRGEITVEKPSTGDTASHTAGKSEIRDINGNKVELTANGAIVTHGPSSGARRLIVDNSPKIQLVDLTVSPGGDSSVATADGWSIYTDDWEHVFDYNGIRFGGIGTTEHSFEVTSDGAVYAQAGAVFATDATGSVGIGVTDPAEKLEIDGTARMNGFTMPTGAAAGYVLTSDEIGEGTWQAPNEQAKASCAGTEQGLTSGTGSYTINYPVTFPGEPYFSVSAIILSGIQTGEVCYVTSITFFGSVDPQVESATFDLQYHDGAAWQDVGAGVQVQVAYTAIQQ
jgi:hypothetical protein